MISFYVYTSYYTWKNWIFKHFWVVVVMILLFVLLKSKKPYNFPVFSLDFYFVVIFVIYSLFVICNPLPIVNIYLSDSIYLSIYVVNKIIYIFDLFLENKHI